MRATGVVAAAVTAVALLTACGQKGALYLPKRGTVVTRPAGVNAQQQPSSDAAPAATTPAPKKPDDKDDSDKPKSPE